MAKPAAKPPRSAPPIELQPAPVRPTLAPAPDNGLHVADAPVATSTTSTPSTAKKARTEAATPAPRDGLVKNFPQLGTRVPPALYERIQRCCAESGVSQAFLITRALEHELSQRGF